MREMRLKIVMIAMFMLLVVQIKAFHISPVEFEQRIDGNGYREFYIINSSFMNSLRYRVSALPGSGTRPSMHQWVTVSPEVLIVKPGERGIVKVFTNAPSDTDLGEYSFFLNFRSVPAPKLPGEVEGDAIGAQAKLALNANVEMVGYAGNLPSNLKIEDYKFSEDKDGKTVITVGIKSNTEKRGVAYDIEIISKKGGVITVDAGRIRAGERKELPVTLATLKKSDVAGIRLRGKENYEELAMEKVSL